MAEIMRVPLADFVRQWAENKWGYPAVLPTGSPEVKLMVRQTLEGKSRNQDEQPYGLSVTVPRGVVREFVSTWTIAGMIRDAFDISLFRFIRSKDNRKMKLVDAVYKFMEENKIDNEEKNFLAISKRIQRINNQTK